jgi:hypothetical protein
MDADHAFLRCSEVKHALTPRDASNALVPLVLRDVKTGYSPLVDMVKAISL